MEKKSRINLHLYSILPTHFCDTLRISKTQELKSKAPK